ncbi:acetyl-CoA carboxylase biotin carboxylase subunit [Photobacterium sp. TY1-4]|uniref:acetyl/propionyl/methylcrotonyl-CoA carboxylase subunit alpha n=1 Tax=Photobacterium sp. TY1-4 TaxID=2899122 RepID=UPI0028F7161E|nr:acetyl-CoA carboxylase biotin carboxylase subunit [Photobacterium sp. TY1-4]
MNKFTDKTLVSLSKDASFESSDPQMSTSPAHHDQAEGEPASSATVIATATASRKITRLLVANRGEIACRIMKTAQAMGIETIAVYSEADRHAKHVRMADHAVLIGPASAQASYLNVSRIIEAATALDADAIHPGYGFLSENAELAQACQQNDLIFIGPPVKAMLAMSSKSEAKSIMACAQVPLLPGYHGEDNDLNILVKAAADIGYPVLVKAALGGGGKGMRIVEHADALPEAIQSAKREARSAFGDDLVLIEKYLTNPRHIEVQVFADMNGNTVYLSDRDCSIQRRHQKIVEEAPAPNLPEHLRTAMGEAAVNAAKAIGYVGAGTVEFLLDGQGQFYFMEMNTRLQVEHPVTELVTGQDLVHWQICVAEGSPLPLQQHEISHRGHAMEVRIYAEDPAQDFLPSSGTLAYLAEPEHSAPLIPGGVQVRVDSGICQGDIVTSHYDPMLAKLIVWSPERHETIRQLSSALAEYRIVGLETNISYLQQIINHPVFVQAAMTTHFIQDHQDDLNGDDAPAIAFPPNQQGDAPIAVPLTALFAALSAIKPTSPMSHWRLNQRPYHVVPVRTLKGETYLFRFEIAPVDPAIGTSQGSLSLTQITIDDQLHDLDISHNHNRIRLMTMPPQADSQLFEIELQTKRYRFTHVHHETKTHIFYQRWHIPYLTGHDIEREQSHEDQAQQAVAPLNGIVTALLCQAGNTVEKDQPLLVIEAMKMEYTVRAPHPGTLSAVLYAIGDQVAHGDLLVEFTE